MPRGKRDDAPAATAKNIAGFLNSVLRVGAIKDASKNGLQVRPKNSGIVKTVGFAVDGCISTFRAAKKQGVDLLVVHHGITWRPEKDRATAQRRESFLTKQGMALYAAHLPLDLHPRYGNNSELCRMLGLRDVKKFGRYHGIKIGFAGTFARATRPGAVAELLNTNLRTRCRVLAFGPSRMRTLGVISGGGGGMLAEAVKEGLDGFLVGEIDLAVFNAARESGINVIAAGHYATETLGVKALMPLVADRFGVKTVFIDDPKDL